MEWLPTAVVCLVCVVGGAFVVCNVRRILQIKRAHTIRMQKHEAIIKAIAEFRREQDLASESFLFKLGQVDVEHQDYEKSLEQMMALDAYRQKEREDFQRRYHAQVTIPLDNLIKEM